MEKPKYTTYNFRLTVQDRNYLDKMADVAGVSSARFLTSLIRQEITKIGKEIAVKVVTCKIAEKYGIPAKIAETLNHPKEVEGFMKPELYLKFFDEVLEQAKIECQSMEENFKPSAEDYED